MEQLVNYYRTEPGEQRQKKFMDCFVEYQEASDER